MRQQAPSETPTGGHVLVEFRLETKPASVDEGQRPQIKDQPGGLGASRTSSSRLT